MCHGGVFERALGPEGSHTHMCAARGLHASAPSQVCPSNGHHANVSHPLRMVSRLSRVGCNTPSQTRVFIIILKIVNGMSFTIHRASFVHVQISSSPILWLSSWPFDLHFQLSQVVSVPFGHVP